MMNVRMSVLLLLATFSLQVNAQVVIDGSITFQEFTDTVDFKSKINLPSRILLKSSKESIYLGVQNSGVGTINLILNRGDEFIIIHISASAGRAIYKKAQSDSLVLVKPLLGVQDNPEVWDYVGAYAYKNILKKLRSPTKTERNKRRCWKNNGYKASTFDEGSYRDFEVLFDKKIFGGDKMLVQYIDSESSGKTFRAFHPKNGIIADQEQIRKFLDASQGTSLRMEFNIKEWIDLSNF